MSILRSPIRLLTVLAVVLLLASACGDDAETDAGEAPSNSDPVVTDPPGEIGCVGDDWSEIDAGDFTLFLPGDLVDKEVQGIDSLVALYERPGLSATYDYGWYSSDFSEIVAMGGSSEAITISGRDARLVVADLSDAPDYGNHVVGLYVAGEPDENGSATSLGLLISHDDAADGAVADCIARSVVFNS